MPTVKRNCDYDPFISSTPFDGKVFLHPWKKSERKADWFEARGYCAANCAELVTIQSAAENEFFLNFMRSVNLDDAVWLGAEVEERVEFSYWSNGLAATYHNKQPSEYDQTGHTCVNAAYLTNINTWWNYYCTVTNYLVACQRPASWSICQ